MTRLGTILGLLVWLLSLPVQAQALLTPWELQNAPRSNGNTGNNTQQNYNYGMHQSYYSNIPGVYDPRYYDSRSGWINPHAPMMVLPTAPMNVQPNYPQNIKRNDGSMINSGLKTKASFVIDVWNAFTGKDWWKGVGQVLSMAVAARIGVGGGGLNSNLAMDQAYMRRSPNQPWATGRGRVVAPNQMNSCEGCDQYQMHNPDGQVGDIFRHPRGPMPYRSY